VWALVGENTEQTFLQCNVVTLMIGEHLQRRKGRAAYFFIKLQDFYFWFWLVQVLYAGNTST